MSRYWARHPERKQQPRSAQRGQARAASRPIIADKGRYLGDPVVELPRGRIEILRQPIDGRSAVPIRRGIDRFDQRPPDARAAHLGVGVEVLQITDLLDAPCVAVKEVMGQANKPAIQLGYETVEIARVIAKKAREG